MRKSSKIFIISLLLLVISVGITTTLTQGIQVTILDSEKPRLVISNLETGIDYKITVEASSLFEYDTGFSIYSKSTFSGTAKLLTVDNPGTNSESAIFDVQSDGDYYVEVWINNGGQGFLDVTVEENISGLDMGLSLYTGGLNGSSSLLWLWILLGVIGIAVIIIIIIAVVVSMLAKAGKQALEEAKKIDFSKIENPLKVLVKKGQRVCPYCKLKIPKEDKVTCPYCGAPITED